MQSKVNNIPCFKTIPVLLLALTMTAMAIVISLLASTNSVYAAKASFQLDKLVNIRVEGKTTSAKGIISESEKTLVPLKDTVKAFGGVVTYHAQTHVIIATKGKEKTVYSMSKNIEKDGIQVVAHGGTLGEQYEGRLVKGVLYVETTALADSFGYLIHWNSKSITVDFTTAGLNQVTITPTQLKNSIPNQYTDVNIVYPVLSGLNNEEAQHDINGALQTHSEKYLAAANQQMQIAGEPHAKDMRYSIQGNYAVTYNQNGIISVVFREYQYVGKAYSGLKQTAMIFNLRDGKVIQLEDILASNAVHVQDLRTFLRLDIKKQGEVKGYTPDKFDALAKNSTAYINQSYLTNNGFTIFFAPYQIAPGDLGILEFHFNWNQFLAPDSNPFQAYQ
ncbi:DUF4163 domain-containing protein [Paenibacillus hunanensis]|uniref:PdaC/SigV domain-containing protein n=1 Tax=Paenibacillus hunanensis TaxID=539262 RepID=UPI002A69D1AC|nr:DUF4163 domain-containing protein [Paenibacillus hunanensis]WPP41524.1 DUF4163 domain-containing protein [Paenibacillus hunanensis]